MNFITFKGLLKLDRLTVNHNLRQLFLMGNPCADFEGYRSFIIGTLPQLTHVDGADVTHVERILARQRLQRITEDLEKAAAAETTAMASVDEIASMQPDERPWCAATRILDNEVKVITSSLGKQKSQTHLKDTGDTFDALPDDVVDVKQKNQGDFNFKLADSEDETAIELEIKVGTMIDTSLIHVDIHPRLVRVKIKGELLQLKLSDEVATDASVAERSKATGKLLITMPKLNWHLKPKSVIRREPKKQDRAARVTYHHVESDGPPDVIC
jgi:protein TilB